MDHRSSPAQAAAGSRGRVLVVEPDNAARYWFSSVESGMIAAELGRRFFGSLAEALGESPASAVGPMIPGVFGSHGIEPISVHLFPVSVSHLGSPPSALWEGRRAAVDQAIARAPAGALRRLGADDQKAIEQYARDAEKAGSTFVEIQNTMLFATVGAVNEPAGRSMWAVRDGSRGWDEYAPFYDWENARTVARRDIGFWQRLAAAQRGPVLELGCGTGRIAVPLLKAGIPLVGIDRSAPMLARARQRLRRAGLADRALLVRGDIRSLPFRGGRQRFKLVMAPYGMLQSLTREADLQATLESIARVLAPGGLLGIDLVPDLPRWAEYRRRVSLRAGRSRRRHAIS